jgi:hypothetical protein
VKCRLVLTHENIDSISPTTILPAYVEVSGCFLDVRSTGSVIKADHYARLRLIADTKASKSAIDWFSAQDPEDFDYYQDETILADLLADLTSRLSQQVCIVH